MHFLGFGCALAVAALLSAPAAAAPFTPVNDDTVLERVPPAGDPQTRDLAVLHRLLQAAPANAEIAARYARAAIQRGRAQGDPRYYGYAAAALDSIEDWRDHERAPVTVLVLRATLLQQQHDFAGAFVLLDRALAREPGNAQARLTRAVLHQVQGRPDAAQQDCAALADRVAVAVLSSCRAAALSLSGHAKDALRLLESALATPASADVRLWPQTLRAEILHRLGQPADAAFQTALQTMRETHQTDFYLLAAYADFLLDLRRAAEIEPLLNPYPATDGLLLRKALAAQALAAPELAAYRQTLRERLAQELARGDDTHLRERAWFELSLNQAAGIALTLAARNWLTQREPLDARLFMEAALAAGDRRAARPVLDWMDETGIEDVRLRELRAALKALP